MSRSIPIVGNTCEVCQKNPLKKVNNLSLIDGLQAISRCPSAASQHLRCDLNNFFKNQIPFLCWALCLHNHKNIKQFFVVFCWESHTFSSKLEPYNSTPSSKKSWTSNFRIGFFGPYINFYLHFSAKKSLFTIILHSLDFRIFWRRVLGS